MTVAKYNAPDYTDAAQTAAIYKAYIDGGMSVLHAVAGDFAPHAQDTPNMTVAVDAGKIIAADGTLTEAAAQNTGTITAPTTNPRIDRVILNPSTGAVSVVTGTEAASPTAPSITAGYLPICQIALTTSTTAITNSMITDERTHVQTATPPLQALRTSGGSTVFDSSDVMQAGTVPLARTLRTTASSATASVDVGTVETGDYILLSITAKYTTNSAAGSISGGAIGVASGTATISYAGQTTVMPGVSIVTTTALATYYTVITIPLYVTAGGALTVGLTGSISASNVTINTSSYVTTALVYR